MDITAQVNALLAAHANDDVWELQESHEVAAMLCGSYSDTFKGMYGFRPRHSITVAEIIEALPKLQREAEEQWEREQVENNTPIVGVLFEGQPLKPGDWDDPSKYWDLE